MFSSFLFREGLFPTTISLKEKALLDCQNTSSIVLDTTILHPSYEVLKNSPFNLIIIVLYYISFHLSIINPLNNHSPFGPCPVSPWCSGRCCRCCFATFFEKNTICLNNRFFFCYFFCKGDKLRPPKVN